MRPTRRFWAVAGIAALFALAAAAFARPGLLVGTAALGGWATAAAYAFLRTVTDVDERLELELVPSAPRTRVDTGLDLTVRGAPIASPATVTARLRLPPGLVAEDTAGAGELRLGATGAETTVAVETPVAGEFTVPAPTVSVTGPRGLFTETFAGDATAEVTVLAPSLGQGALVTGPGGEGIAISERLETAEQQGRGLEPAEIRRYVPGETADRIDWNATARLPETYVREFETEAVLRTVFVLDARGLGGGADRQAAFAHLRSVALGALALARANRDPVGLAIIDDEGITAVERPTDTAVGYRRCRRRLLAAGPGSDRTRPRRRRPSGSLPRRLANTDADSAFVATLSDQFVNRRPVAATDSPLLSSVRLLVSGEGAADRTVLFTTDARRSEVKTAVDRAAGGARSVSVFLTPTVFYEADPLSDLPAAYEAYASFERFRRELDHRPRVSAIEVGPRDRLEEFAAGRARQR